MASDDWDSLGFGLMDVAGAVVEDQPADSFLNRALRSYGRVSHGCTWPMRIIKPSHFYCAQSMYVAMPASCNPLSMKPSAQCSIMATPSLRA